MGFGRVTYPITFRDGAGGGCSGSITFDWGWLGWQESTSGYSCLP